MSRAWLATFLGICLVLGLGGCRKGEQQGGAAMAEEEPTVAVTVQPVVERTLERVIRATGTLRGWEEVSVGCKRAGRVLRVLHDMGERVEAGAELVALETVDADLAVEQGEKQLLTELAKLGLTSVPDSEFDLSSVPSVVQSKVALDQARRELTRSRGLAQRGATSVAELQDVEDRERGASATLDEAMVRARSTLANALAAKVALEVARQAREDMLIRAPVPSTVPETGAGKPAYAITERLVSEGQMVAAGQELYVLVIEDPLRLVLKVPEQFTAKIAEGQEARVFVAAYPGRAFGGKVRRINPGVDPASRTFQVEVLVGNEEGLLRPGGFVEGEILINRQDRGATVPLESVAEFAGVTKVFLVNGDRAKAVPVKRGQQGEGWVEVEGEVPVGAMVATSGQSQLADGTRVRVRANDSEAPNASEATARPVSEKQEGAAKAEVAKATEGVKNGSAGPR